MLFCLPCMVVRGRGLPLKYVNIFFIQKFSLCLVFDWVSIIVILLANSLATCIWLRKGNTHVKHWYDIFFVFVIKILILFMSFNFIVSPARYPSSCIPVVGVGVTKYFCHIFLGNHRGQLSDIWHRASVCRMKDNGWHYVVYTVHVGLKTLDQHRTNRWQLRRTILVCFRLFF